ncbi:MAG: hypothetical protein GTO76_12535, partial [Planctomycetales bacterium]|nr:hypothetical protein [Planctomycetales bacterium]NIN09441.1 hypothetical protein [Planctomycetales bacterium]NIN78550.1 hypothetical protein [Planctomycetales bacterium]NIP05619.1 hypothetical protein [Planctomycetales bacterium]
LSQCSLATMWAVSSRSSSYLRFALPPLVLVASWYVLTRLLPWGIGDPVSAGWALALAVQMLAIVLVMVPYRYVHNFRAGRHPQGDRRQRRYPTYKLSTLILWGTVVACGLTFIRFGRSGWAWTARVAEWEFFAAMPVQGLYNALFALLWLWVFAAGGWGWRIAKAGIVSYGIVCLAVSQPYVMRLFAGEQPLPPGDFLILAGGQSGLVVVSLGVVFLGPLPALGRSQGAPAAGGQAGQAWGTTGETVGNTG